MNETKICLYCGRIITAEGRSKFCSAECQQAFHKKDKIKEKENIL